MIKFPNSSFRKYSYPQNNSLKLRSINSFLVSQNYMQYEDCETYNKKDNNINNSIK